jgi:TRAP-type mannitol/chloroaromatic compound transport system permease large subunit
VYASRHLIPVILPIVVVLGSIYAGVATATEAAAFGVVARWFSRHFKAR